MKSRSLFDVCLVKFKLGYFDKFLWPSRNPLNFTDRYNLKIKYFPLLIILESFVMKLVGNYEFYTFSVKSIDVFTTFSRNEILSNRRVRRSTFKELKSRYEIGYQKVIEMLISIWLNIFLHFWISAVLPVVLVVELVLVLFIRSTFDLLTKTSVLSYTTLG